MSRIGRRASGGTSIQVMAETYPALDELRQQKVIRALGLGMNQWQMLADFARAGDFDALFAGWPLYAAGAGIAARAIAAVFGEGGAESSLVGRTTRGFWLPERSEGAYYNYAPAADDVLEKVRRIEAVCARHEVPLSAAAPAISLWASGGGDRHSRGADCRGKLPLMWIA